MIRLNYLLRKLLLHGIFLFSSRWRIHIFGELLLSLLFCYVLELFQVRKATHACTCHQKKTKITEHKAKKWKKGIQKKKFLSPKQVGKERIENSWSGSIKMVIFLFTGNNYTHMYITLLGFFFFQSTPTTVSTFFSPLWRPSTAKHTVRSTSKKHIYEFTIGLNKGLRPVTTISYGCTLVTQFTQEASISYAMK